MVPVMNLADAIYISNDAWWQVAAVLIGTFIDRNVVHILRDTQKGDAGHTYVAATNPRILHGN